MSFFLAVSSFHGLFLTRVASPRAFAPRASLPLWLHPLRPHHPRSRQYHRRLTRTTLLSVPPTPTPSWSSSPPPPPPGTNNRNTNSIVGWCRLPLRLIITRNMNSVVSDTDHKGGGRTLWWAMPAWCQYFLKAVAPSNCCDGPAEVLCYCTAAKPKGIKPDMRSSITSWAFGPKQNRVKLHRIDLHRFSLSASGIW
jgi:hypothetical protein